MSAQPAATSSQGGERQLREDIAGYRDDPLGYALYNFPWGVQRTSLAGKKLRRWQHRQLGKITAKLRSGAVSRGEVIKMAVASGHGIGKSALVSILIKWAFDTLEDTRGVVTANTERQLMTKTWPELTKWHNLSLTKHWAECTATALISTDPGHDKTWRIDAVPWSEQNTEAFAGLHNEGKRVLLVFDEASAIGDRVWEVAMGALTDANTEIIWAVFGNPTRNTGEFRQCFGRNRHMWDCEQIDSRTVEGINLVEIQAMVDSYGEDSDLVKVRVRGQFPSSSSRQLISVEDADAGRGRHLDKTQFGFAPRILTCDPAWTGEDKLEIGLRQGLAFWLLRTIPKNDNDLQIAAILASLEDKYEADAVFIDAGYGTGIKSAGDTMNRSWTLVWFGAQATKPGFVNKRAEMWVDMRDWLKAGGAYPDNQELYDDLIGPELKATLDGKIKLESKEEMKSRGLPSPNKGDCLALSFAYPVQSKASLRALEKLGGVTERAVTSDDRDRYAR